MNIIPIPAGEDNYSYILESQGFAAVVDPVDAGCLWTDLTRRQLSLTHILVTHHHADHIAGVSALADRSGARVLAGEADRIPHVDQVVRGGDEFEVGEVRILVLATPGHGDQDISYLMTAPSHPAALFCGDVLFVGGCGRILEGSAEQLWVSLQSLKALPDDTQVYCGHEYTEENLRFACHMLPREQVYRQRLNEVRTLRSQNQPTIPSTIGREKIANPFLRAPDLRTFRELRQAKDRF